MGLLDAIRERYDGNPLLGEPPSGLLSVRRPKREENASSLIPQEGILSRLATMAAPIPVVGDIAGLVNDAYMYATKPETRTPVNYGLSAIGALPFIPALAGQTVFHGSPYKFERFDPTKIGTGEGAQVYGYGHYVAENPTVAEVYRNALSRHEMADASGKVVYNPMPKNSTTGPITPEDRAANALQYAFDSQSSSPYQLAGNVIRRTEDKDAIAKAWDVLAKWEEAGVRPRPQGGLYKIDLPDEHIGKMLDWDKPLSQQPKIVQDAFAAHMKQRISVNEGGHPANQVSQSWLDAIKNDTITGKDIYQAMGFGNPRSASANLLESGIPGVRYLDQGSRATGKGTYNYVVFPGNEDLLKILERQ